MNEKIKNLILSSEFKKAYIEIKRFDNNKIFGLLVNLAYDSENITVYAFVFYVLSLKETSFLHLIASAVLSYSLCIIEGSYQTSYFHARRALELDPDDVGYMDYLLSFHEIPDKLLEKKEAIELAKKILKIEPNSMRAKNVLKRYDIDSH